MRFVFYKNFYRIFVKMIEYVDTPIFIQDFENVVKYFGAIIKDRNNT